MLDPWWKVIAVATLWVSWGTLWRAALGFAVGYGVWLMFGGAWTPWVLAAMAGAYGLVVHGIGAASLIRMRREGISPY